MTITGRGLGYDIQVSIGSQPCHVISASPDEYICTVPMAATTGTVPIEIETSDGITYHGSFTYNNTGLPVVTAVEPTIIYGPGKCVRDELQLHAHNVWIRFYIYPQ